ncbi:MAG: FKBP-type peptidyl-prolyl cis-trans isomerase [Marinomonas sp.]|uniref:FKBP-type peptidyl-prolyl cis-trans isomerase n=1 Tax=unclassified Marinomonas TaxID=196814 RepID=UPI0005FA280C|nr:MULTISPECIES: FKBP-type peptidyl-prolyl cis-trans isomerase [unclassified Marinomonas]KJZ08416.1 peptidylprolyl isomerase [Marinomonas sp. S3726]KZM38871.1 peptidylprolyl isomerase [Marinomonas sp. SBI22]KZM39493.1 peptidylprolyl isomerase [Marinomonas sp. SBI8L]
MIMISKTSQITMHFELALEDGQLVDSNFDKAPAEFKFGDGSLLEAFEDVLLGLKEGDECEFTMPPEKAFGQHNPNNVQTMPRSQFDMDLEEGMIVSFADVGKNELPGVIASIAEDEVTVDFNHPLAGRTLTYRVKIVSVSESV